MKLNDLQPPVRRSLGELEQHYLQAFDRFARMIAEGSFPFRHDDEDFEDAPRVGDGVIILDADLRVLFASPNTVSAMHRFGIHSYTSGLRLAEMGFDQEAVDVAIRARLPVSQVVGAHASAGDAVRAFQLGRLDALLCAGLLAVTGN